MGDCYSWVIYIEYGRAFTGTDRRFFSQFRDGRVVVAHGTEVIDIVSQAHVIDETRVCCSIRVDNATSIIEGCGWVVRFSHC